MFAFMEFASVLFPKISSLATEDKDGDLTLCFFNFIFVLI